MGCNKIKNRNHPRHEIQCAIEYPTKINHPRRGIQRVIEYPTNRNHP